MLNINNELLPLQQTAEWRASLADRFPEDTDRNNAASALLWRFSEELEKFEGSALHHRIERHAGDEEFTGEVDYILKAVGFKFHPKSCEELLIYIAQQLEHRCASDPHLKTV